MLEFVLWIAVVSMAAAFLILLADKWRWREWLQVHADYFFGKLFCNYSGDFFNRLFNCNFCCSWWISLIICLILFVATGNTTLLAVPVCSTVITRKLL